MFIVQLFTTARTRQQPKRPSTEEWIKKIWCVYTVEYYSAIKRNEIVSFTEMWINIGLTQSEESQKEKNKYCISTHTCGI